MLIYEVNEICLFYGIEHKLKRVEKIVYVWRHIYFAVIKL